MNTKVRNIFDTALEDLRKVVRDCFIEGKDAEAIAILQSAEYKIVESRNTKSDRSVLPISSHLIRPGENCILVARPQVPAFKADRFAVSPRCAPYFVVHDMRVGNQYALPAAGSIDGMSLGQAPDFAWESVDVAEGETPLLNIQITSAGELALGVPIDFPTCQTAMDMVVTVENISAMPCRFYAMWLGIIPRDIPGTFDEILRDIPGTFDEIL